VRILFLSEFFEPEPMMKGLQFARAFVSRGHEVQVLTGFPNYPGGRVYPGYRIRPYQADLMDGIVVHRVPLFPSHDRSVSRRMATYLSFAASASLIGPFKVFRPDVVYVYHSPATLGIPAGVIKLFKGARIVSDILDLWPDTVLTSGMWDPGPLRAPLDWLCKAAYRTADAIVVPAPGLKRLLVGRGFDADRISVIYNWAHGSDAGDPGDPGAMRQRLGWSSEFVVLFAGTIGVMQGLDTLIDAAGSLKRSAPHVRLAFIGGGVEVPRLADRARAEGLTNVSFLDRVPQEEIGQYFAAADAMIVHLKRDPLFEVMIPAKTQGYMAAGRPLVMAVSGNAADVVARAQCGVIAEPSDAASVASAIERLAMKDPAELQQMGQNAKAFYHREMSMESGIPRFEAVFRGARPTEYAPVEP
jgi:glycosyltransferase involved in cell wall biosynthesis